MLWVTGCESTENVSASELCIRAKRSGSAPQLLPESEILLPTCSHVLSAQCCAPSALAIYTSSPLSCSMRLHHSILLRSAYSNSSSFGVPCVVSVVTSPRQIG